MSRFLLSDSRRTRRNAKRYLSNWVSWTSSKLGEDASSFLDRALKEQEGTTGYEGDTLQWMFHERTNMGQMKTVRRNPGTVQKDWAIVKSHSLPKDFCIAVIGHEGWSKDPDTTANYAIAVSFEILGKKSRFTNHFKPKIKSKSNPSRLSFDSPNQPWLLAKYLSFFYNAGTFLFACIPFPESAIIRRGVCRHSLLRVCLAVVLRFDCQK